MFHTLKQLPKLLAGLALAGAAGVAGAQNTIKVGWLSSLTGPLSSAAIAENQGVQLAVDEINAAGGINGRMRPSVACCPRCWPTS